MSYYDIGEIREIRVDRGLFHVSKVYRKWVEELIETPFESDLKDIQERIKKIEDCIYELGQIVNNPLEVTTTEGNLTPIELAKKINYEYFLLCELCNYTQNMSLLLKTNNVYQSLNNVLEYIENPIRKDLEKVIEKIDAEMSIA